MWTKLIAENRGKVFFTVSLIIILLIIGVSKFNIIKNHIDPSPEPAPYQDYNILIISIDALNADHIGAYGYHKTTSPFIDNFAEESVVFENAFCPRSHTAPSLFSMLTSLYPISHGVRGNRQIMRADVPTIASILKEDNIYI